MISCLTLAVKPIVMRLFNDTAVITISGGGEAMTETVLLNNHGNDAQLEGIIRLPPHPLRYFSIVS